MCTRPFFAYLTCVAVAAPKYQSPRFGGDASAPPLLATVSCSVVAWVSSQVPPQGLVALKLIPTVPNALALDACGAPSKTSAFQVISKSVKPAATTVD